MDKYRSLGALNSSDSSGKNKKNLAAAALAAGVLVASESVQAQGEYPLTAQEYAQATQAKAAKVVSTPKELAEFFAHGGVAHFDSTQPYIGAGVNTSNVATNVQATLDGKHAVAAVGAYTDNNAGAAVRVGYGEEWPHKAMNIEGMIGGENLSVVGGRQVTSGGEYNKVVHDYVGPQVHFPLSNNVRTTASVTRHRVDNGPETKYHNQGTLGLEGRWPNWVYVSAKASKNLGGNKATSSEVRVGIQRGSTNVHWYVNKQSGTSPVIGFGVSHALGEKNSEEANSLPKWDTNPYAQYVHNTNVADAPHGIRNYLENYGVKKYQPNTQTTQPNTPSTPNKPNTQTEKLDLSKLPKEVAPTHPFNFSFDFKIPDGYSIVNLETSVAGVSLSDVINATYNNGKITVENNSAVTVANMKASIQNNTTKEIIEHIVRLRFF